MKLQRFEVESYMTLHENNCRYNLADTVAKSLTLKELLAYDKKDSLEDLMNLSLDYGAIEGSHELKKGILSLYQSGDDEEIAICHGGVNANELVLMTLLSTNDHIWNVVNINNKWYHIDLTWDDPIVSTGKDVIIYDYFLITTDELKNKNDGDHNFNEEIYNFLY